MSMDHKVLIFGISPAIPKDLLISMLLQFGDMVTMFIDGHKGPNGLRSGHVVYKTKLECYRAITELNDQPPYYLSMQYGDIVIKDENKLCKQPAATPVYSSLTSSLYRETQTKHTSLTTRDVIHGTRVNWNRVVETVERREVVANEEVSPYPSERDNYGNRNYYSNSLANGIIASESIATGVHPEFEEACAVGTGVQEFRGAKKKTGFDGTADKSNLFLFGEQQDEESCEECGITYCSKRCQINDLNKIKHEGMCRKYGGKESLLVGENSTKKYLLSTKEEKGLCGNSAMAQSPRTSYKEAQDDGADNSLVQAIKAESSKEGSKFLAKQKLIRKARENHDKKKRNLTHSTEAIERRKSVDTDIMNEANDENLKSFEPKNGVIKSNHWNEIHYDESLKGACNRRVLSDGKVTKLVSGIGRGVRVSNYWVGSQSSPTAMSGNDSEHASGFKSENQCDEFIVHDASKRLSDQHVEEQAIEESVRSKPSTSKHTSLLSRKMERLVAFQNVKKNEVENSHPTETGATLSKKEELTTKSESPNISENKSYPRRATSEEAPKADKNISSPELTTSKRTSSLSGSVRKLESAQDRKYDNKDAWKDGIRKNLEASTKVNKLPGSAEINKTEAYQKIPDDSASTLEDIQWDLLSKDPKTQLVNYDLCTQQKKLSSDVFSKVTISSLLSPDEFWVQSFDKEELEVIQNLLRNKKNSKVPFKPSLGEYCCVVHSDSRYRAKVISIKDSEMEEVEIVIFLIDNGKFCCTKAELLEELPNVAKNFYAQAMHIKVDPRTPAKYLDCKEGALLAVKPSGMIKGTTKVQLKGVLYAQEIVVPMQLSLDSIADNLEGGATTGTTGRIQWPLSVLSLLKKGDEVSCTVLNVLLSEEDKDEAVVVIGSEYIADKIESLAIDLPNDCMEKPEDPEFNTSVGDMVAAFSSKVNCWVRSIVLDFGDRRWLVACLDFGCIEEVHEICEIPEDKKYRRTLVLSAECCITKSMFAKENLFCEGRIERNVTLSATVLEKKEDCLECRIGPNGDETFCFATLRPWSPKPNCSAYATLSDVKILPHSDLNLVKLMPGCSVKIVSFFESLIIYVQPCDAESKLLLEDLHESISDSAVQNSTLEKDPIEGKKYICQHSGDMKYYRVVVEKVISPAKIKVFYIDHGNEETVPRGRLYELPKEFDKIPCYAVKIELKNEFNMKINKEVRKYLFYLIMENKELVLNYSAGNLRNADLFIYGNSLGNILKRLVKK